jgi:arylsulfatase A-like enzyme
MCRRTPGVLWMGAIVAGLACGVACDGEPDDGGRAVAKRPSGDAAHPAPKTLIPEAVTLIPEDVDQKVDVLLSRLPALPDAGVPPSPDGASGDEAPRDVVVADRNAPDVILIVIDTLRADFTSLFGNRHDTTPFLAKLARKSVLYKNAYATAKWTVPSMFSVMTGLYSGQHGVDTASVVRGNIAAQPVLSERAYTLAEQLREAGYDTFAVCTNQHLAGKYGMSQGFRRFVGDSFDKLPFPEYAASALAPEIRRARPYFLWLHYFDPHHPYGAIRPWMNDWNDSGFSGYEDIGFDILSRMFRNRHRMPRDAPIPIGAFVPIYRRALSMRGLGHPSLLFSGYASMKAPPAEGTTEARYLKFLKAAYESEIRAADESIRKVFAELEFDDDDMIIVTSDHGEELMEHGRIGHRYFDSLSQELIHVPMLIKFPKNRWGGTVVNGVVSLVDIVPTIRGVLGQKPLEGLPGTDLSVRGPAKPSAPARVFTKSSDLGVVMRSVIEYPWKLVVVEGKQDARLYDLARDPYENADVAAETPAVVERLSRAIADWKKIDTPRWAVEKMMTLTAEESERLRAMGYLK